VPALVGRLDDADPVVRLAAHEELRKRTGQDFGYLPWSSDAERSSAVAQWRAWMARGVRSAGPVPSTQSPATLSQARKTVPSGSAQAPNP
jgi:hypothetical protein